MASLLFTGKRWCPGTSFKKFVGSLEETGSEGWRIFIHKVCRFRQLSNPMETATCDPSYVQRAKKFGEVIKTDPPF